MEQLQSRVETRDLTRAEVQNEVSTIFLAKVFNWMAAGLGITGLVALFTVYSGMAQNIAATPPLLDFADW